MDVKRIRVTNRKQFELLVKEMEANPEVAKGLKFCEVSGINQATYSKVWMDLTIVLNSLGPPTRPEKEWQKVWTDYKLTVKKKLAHNKRESNATGGGPNRLKILSSTEEAVAKLMCLDKMVNNSTPTFGLTCSVPGPSSSFATYPTQNSSPSGSPLPNVIEQQIELSNEECIIEQDENIEKSTNNLHISRAAKRKRMSSDCQDVKLDLMVQQTELLKKIAQHTGECAHYVRKAYELREIELKLRREYLQEKEKDRKTELEYKRRKLELLELREMDE